MVIWVYLELRLGGDCLSGHPAGPKGAQPKLLGNILIVGRAGFVRMGVARCGRVRLTASDGEQTLYTGIWCPRKGLSRTDGSERLNDDENDDEHHEDRGNFVPGAVEASRARVSVQLKILPPLTEQVMGKREPNDQHELRL